MPRFQEPVNMLPRLHVPRPTEIATTIIHFFSSQKVIFPIKRSKMELTLPYWTFVESRNVWGRFGYLLFSSCRRDSALSNSDSILSNSDTGSLTKDHDVRTGDLPLTCAVTLSFHANMAASNLLTASRALCSDFKSRELSISSAVFESAVNTLYSSSPRFAFPDCKKDNRSYSKCH